MNNIGSFLHNALTSLGNYFTPHMQSPIPNRDSFPDASGLQDYYAHQQNNDPNSFMPQAGAQAKPQPTQRPQMRQQQQPTQQPMKTSSQTPTEQYNQGSSGILGFTTAPVPSDYNKLITQAAKEVGINPALFASQLFTEHGFSRNPGWNKNVDRITGKVSWDRGPAQINNVQHPDVTDAQALDMNFAIPWAARLLKSYIDQTGSNKGGVEAYRIGPQGYKNNPLNEYGVDELSKVKRGLTPELIKQLGL